MSIAAITFAAPERLSITQGLVKRLDQVIYIQLRTRELRDCDTGRVVKRIAVYLQLVEANVSRCVMKSGA